MSSRYHPLRGVDTWTPEPGRYEASSSSRPLPKGSSSNLPPRPAVEGGEGGQGSPGSHCRKSFHKNNPRRPGSNLRQGLIDLSRQNGKRNATNRPDGPRDGPSRSQILSSGGRRRREDENTRGFRSAPENNRFGGEALSSNNPASSDSQRRDENRPTATDNASSQRDRRDPDDVTNWFEDEAPETEAESQARRWREEIGGTSDPPAPVKNTKEAAANRSKTPGTSSGNQQTSSPRPVFSLVGSTVMPRTIPAEPAARVPTPKSVNSGGGIGNNDKRTVDSTRTQERTVNGTRINKERVVNGNANKRELPVNLAGSNKDCVGNNNDRDKERRGSLQPKLAKRPRIHSPPKENGSRDGGGSTGLGVSVPNKGTPGHAVCSNGEAARTGSRKTSGANRPTSGNEAQINTSANATASQPGKQTGFTAINVAVGAKAGEPNRNNDAISKKKGGRITTPKNTAGDTGKETIVTQKEKEHSQQRRQRKSSIEMDLDDDSDDPLLTQRRRMITARRTLASHSDDDDMIGIDSPNTSATPAVRSNNSNEGSTRKKRTCRTNHCIPCQWLNSKSCSGGSPCDECITNIQLRGPEKVKWKTDVDMKEWKCEYDPTFVTGRREIPLVYRFARGRNIKSEGAGAVEDDAPIRASAAKQTKPLTFARAPFSPNNRAAVSTPAPKGSSAKLHAAAGVSPHISDQNNRRIAPSPSPFAFKQRTATSLSGASSASKKHRIAPSTLAPRARSPNRQQANLHTPRAASPPRSTQRKPKPEPNSDENDDDDERIASVRDLISRMKKYLRYLKKKSTSHIGQLSRASADEDANRLERYLGDPRLRLFLEEEDEAYVKLSGEILKRTLAVNLADCLADRDWLLGGS